MCIYIYLLGGACSECARKYSRIFGIARGMNWLETEGRASLMRSRRALGPAPSALIWHFGAVFIEQAPIRICLRSRRRAAA